MNYIKTIIDQINAGVIAGECLSNVTTYGLTELLTRDGKTNPIEIKSVDACSIVPDDRKPLQIYHRLNSQRDDESELSTGRDDMRFFNCEMSLFAIGVREFLKPGCNLKDHDLANVISSLIIKRPAPISGIMQPRIRQTAISANTNNILKDEFDGFDFKKLNQIKIIAIKIEYIITGHVCELIC